MLEKIGLPAKPSLRGNNWVVDASHCQGCSSPFTFINRKHHCRRCGGIFCGSCSQQRMQLRGQGDSPVRICEPCKKLEEAARFELRHGQKSRGGSKLTPKNEDEVLNQILGTDAKRLSGKDSSMSSVSDLQRGMSSASCSNPRTETLGLDAEGDILRSLSVDMQSDALNEMGTTSPDELRQQALEEKKKYRILKGEGKPEEALKAFKRGKDLERQAGALEVALRKSRRKVTSTSSLTGIKKKNDEAEVIGKKSKPSQMAEDRKDDLASELKELGWSDADLHDVEKKPAKMTLEGELSNLLGEVRPKSSSVKGTGAIDKTQVIAHKKNALMFKREGKLAEAKEELKKAKILERQLEEQEFLADAEDSDDEISSLIRSMDDDKSDDLLMQYEKDPGFDSVPIVNFSDDYGLDGNIEVMDEDMDDPEMALTLKSLGWTEDSDHQEEAMPQVVPMDKDALRNEILALKREALNQKRAGNNAEAMAQLKKAKLLEKDLESTQFESQETSYLPPNPVTVKVADASVGSVVSMGTKPPPKSKLMIQRELLALKKKALTLRREGRLDEAEEELKKGKALEQQLDEMENPSKVSANKASVVSKDRERTHGDAFASGSLASGEEGEDEEVTEQDMHDPALLSLLENLGWKEDVEPVSIASRPKQNNYPTEDASNLSVNEVPEIPVVAPRRSKAQMQRELLGLKRKALNLRRQGNTEEAEEVLVMAKELEAQMEEIDAPKKEMPIDSTTNTELHGLGPLTAQKNHGTTAVVEDVKKAVAESLIDLGSKESNTPKTSPRSASISVSEICQTVQDNNIPLIENLSSLVDTRASADADYVHQTLNLMDLPAEVDQKGSQSTLGATESRVIFDTNISDPNIQTETRRSPNKEMGMKGENLSDKQENRASIISREANHEAKTTPVSESFSDQNSLRQEILARKRKAVALKREGKLAEALEELRQTKLLEKNLINDNPQPSAQHTTPVASVASTNGSSIGQEEPKTTKPAPKPMSSRDRFKLQQQSLAHKRQAMKLRREGRMEEAEAESEKAKALENQLEELTAHDSSKSEAMDDVGVEDFLDPQLLFALKAIGLQDAEPVSKSPEKPEPVSKSPEKPEPAKPNAEKVENSSQERSQLEERIKAEKVKALNLKRAGKQAEALDALRRAKQYEKKLSSLVS